MKLSKLLPARWLYYLKLPFKRWAYEIIDQMVIHFVKPGKAGGVLVYRLDLLGDYLMCRPFFQALRHSPLLAGSSLSFAGNSILKDLAEELDADVFTAFIWIDRNRFINSLFYRLRVLADVRRKGFSTVIYPSHTRQYWLESVVRVSGASRRITATPVGRYMEDWEQRLSSIWYSNIIETGKEPLFEFFRNRNFISALSQKASEINSMKDATFEGVQKSRLILIAPGASTRERKWPSSDFSSLLRELSTNITGFSFGLVGSKLERPYCEAIIRQSGVQAHNFAGECSLPESLRLIAGAYLLIANESGPVHMAASTGTACVCISNGNHFSRWNPYPKALAGNIITCYPAYFGDPEANREVLTQQYHDGSRIPASDVSFDAVFQAAEQLLSKSISDFGQNP